MENAMSGTTKPAQSFFSRKLFHLLLIAVLGLLVYSITLHVPFQWDDAVFIEQNPIVMDLGYFLSPSKAKGMVLYGALKSRYVGYLTFALNYALGGLDVRGYHLFNIVIHIANALLFYTLVFLPSGRLFLPVALWQHGHPISLFFPLCSLSRILSRLKRLPTSFRGSPRLSLFSTCLPSCLTYDRDFLQKVLQQIPSMSFP